MKTRTERILRRTINTSNYFKFDRKNNVVNIYLCNGYPVQHIKELNEKGENPFIEAPPVKHNEENELMAALKRLDPAHKYFIHYASRRGEGYPSKTSQCLAAAIERRIDEIERYYKAIKEDGKWHPEEGADKVDTLGYQDIFRLSKENIMDTLLEDVLSAEDPSEEYWKNVTTAVLCEVFNSDTIIFMLHAIESGFQNDEMRDMYLKENPDVCTESKVEPKRHKYKINQKARNFRIYRKVNQFTVEDEGYT